MRSFLFKFVLLTCCLSGIHAHASLVDFYGHHISIPTHDLENVRTSATITKTGIANQLYSLSLQDHNDLLSQVYEAKFNYNLDDLGVILFTDKIAKSISTNANTQHLIQYFLLNNLGYDVRLTYTRNSISCFGNMENKPASSVFIIQDGKRYTNLEFRNGKTLGTRYLYKSESTDGQPFAFTGAVPNIDAHRLDRNFKWVFQGKLYELQAVNNQSFTDYLNDLPQFKLGKEYTQISHSDLFNQSVLTPLRNFMADMSTNEQKANFLLKFVQSSFSYKTDQAQYGREKYNYPEETLSSPYSDCEDRTILLAFLYKEILGFESVILHFRKEKHVCLGLKLPNRSNSYSFTYKNEAFMVCEPTGRGYKVGDTAIGLNHISEVIDLF